MGVITDLDEGNISTSIEELSEEESQEYLVVREHFKAQFLKGFKKNQQGQVTRVQDFVMPSFTLKNKQVEVIINVNTSSSDLFSQLSSIMDKKISYIYKPMNDLKDQIDIMKKGKSIDDNCAFQTTNSSAMLASVQEPLYGMPTSYFAGQTSPLQPVQPNAAGPVRPVQQTSQTGAMVVGPVTSTPNTSTLCSAILSRTNEMTNCVQPSPSQESDSPHEPILVNVHGNSTGHAPISSVQTMVQDNPIEHHLTSVAQASTSGRCKADPAKLKEDLASAMKTKFGVDIGNSILYQKPYPAEFDLVSFPPGWCVPDFVKFSGDDNRAPWEHIDQYILQLGKAGFHEALRIRLFSLSLTGTAFSWSSSLTPNSIQSWNKLEHKFHDRFYNGHNEAKLSDLASVRQGQDE